jgi:leucyl aminopeptidase
MPLWPEFKEQMKGNHADLKNAGGRWGGACTAAAFLSHFVDDHPSWAHLDIAGPAMRKDPKGASGYGVASTFRWLSSLEGASSDR